MAKSPSGAEFIYKASGIKSRYVYARDGMVDPNRMRPIIPARSDALSCQAEIGVAAARRALESAAKAGKDVDAIIVLDNTQRAYPAIAIESNTPWASRALAQISLVACSAATLALPRMGNGQSGSANSVLVVNQG